MSQHCNPKLLLEKSAVSTKLAQRAALAQLYRKRRAPVPKSTVAQTPSTLPHLRKEAELPSVEYKTADLPTCHLRMSLSSVKQRLSQAGQLPYSFSTCARRYYCYKFGPCVMREQSCDRDKTHNTLTCTMIMGPPLPYMQGVSLVISTVNHRLTNPMYAANYTNTTPNESLMEYLSVNGQTGKKYLTFYCAFCRQKRGFVIP